MSKFFFVLYFPFDLFSTAHLIFSVGPSVRLSVQCYFRTTNMAAFEGKRSSNGIIINGTMSEEVAYDVLLRSYDANDQYYIKVQDSDKTGS